MTGPTSRLCLIDAIEGRDMATADIPGAFLQGTMDDDVYIKFEGKMVDVLVDLDSAIYGLCVCSYKDHKLIYGKAVKAIYGSLHSALLFYQLFSGEFVPNKYDVCTMNEIVNGK